MKSVTATYFEPRRLDTTKAYNCLDNPDNTLKYTYRHERDRKQYETDSEGGGDYGTVLGARSDVRQGAAGAVRGAQAAFQYSFHYGADSGGQGTGRTYCLRQVLQVPRPHGQGSVQREFPEKRDREVFRFVRLFGGVHSGEE